MGLLTGLAVHSMGGYGTVRIGMKHPEVFSALYLMSPCCLSARGSLPPEEGRKLEAVKTPEEAQSLGFMERATFAVASAWSSNPKKPPFYVDLPTKDGETQPDVIARWAANAPLAMVYQYISNMRQYKAIAFYVGNRDGLKTDTEALHVALENYGVANSFALYDGDHVSGVANRFQNHVLPFFAKALVVHIRIGPPSATTRRSGHIAAIWRYQTPCVSGWPSIRKMPVSTATTMSCSAR